MKGHKTNGGWDDVTSTARNEIVFEGRHKEYGAYYIRQRYNSALLLGLLFSLSAGFIAAGIPTLINMLATHAPFSSTYTHPTEIPPTTYTINIDKPHVTPPTPRPPKPTNTVANTPPVVSNNVAKTDSDKTALDKQNVDVAVETTTGPPSPPTPPTPPTPPSAGPATSDQPMLGPDVMPKFPGDLGAFITNHADYPNYIREAGIVGTVYASFVVEADGSISNVKILRGVAGADVLSKSTITAIQEMPNWQPGLQKGHPVRVQYVLPVHFELH